MKSVRFSAKRDPSWPIGVAAPVVALASGFAFVYSRVVGPTAGGFRHPGSAVIAVVLVCASVVLACVAILLAAGRSPTGRGWRPAAATLAVICVLLAPAFMVMIGAAGS